MMMETTNVAHEINVTPFIDVMLVLLIIFMIAAPLATVNVPLDLPVSTAEPQPKDEEPIVLSVQSDLTLSVGDAPVSRQGLAGVLKAATGGNAERRIFLRADKSVDYGALMDVMNALRDAGYVKVALVGLESGRVEQGSAP
ncbi:MAG: TonB system transport protein ExbD [Gammaproteobacteria bacterium]